MALLDCLAALGILAGGMFMALAFFRAEVRETRYTQDRFAALLIAQSEIERLYTLPYERILVVADRPLALDLPSAKRVKGVTGQLTVTEPEPGLKAATVRIEWKSPKDRVMHITLSCRLSREGLGR